MSSNRPKLSPISEEMKAWSAALAAEIGDWPQVSTRSFFGFTALYRRDKIFAALPRTRAMGSPNSLAFKLESTDPGIRKRIESDARIDTTQMQSTRWFTFTIAANSDLHGAIDWLEEAYNATGKGKPSKSKKRKKTW
jgi:hypothetical protein